MQSALKVPKAQKNSFGAYNYRSCEDILEPVKPLAHGHGCTVTLTDVPVEIASQSFVIAIQPPQRSPLKSTILDYSAIAYDTLPGLRPAASRRQAIHDLWDQALLDAIG